MKIAIIGSGAMGLLFGTKLALSGKEVTMVDVVPDVIEAINKNGISLDTDEGSFTVPVKASRAEDMKEPVDLAILFTKTIYSRFALEVAHHYVDENTWFLTMQNGLGNIELIEEFVPKERIIAGVTTWSSDLKGPGHAATHGKGYLRMASANGEVTDGLIAIKDALSDAGLGSEIFPDVMVAIWEKVAFNAAINATTAICRIPCGGMGKSDLAEELLYLISDEVCEVANRSGIKASAEDVRKTLKNTLTEHYHHFSSMSQDVLAKRKTENEFISGGVVKKAKELGMEVPYNQAMYMLLNAIENTYDLAE
ncbi:MAG TPA: 2-dehydropantoate 2-reductase [Mogibacterium sp.]|nr:2-dehydropantoate 2-reductase [Mogibacterium sp.]